MAESKVQIILEAVTAQATSAIEGAANSIKGSLNSIQSAASNISNGLNDLISDARLASGVFVGAFGLISKGAMDTAADFEKAGIMTKFLTKSTEDAHTFTKAMIDLALGSQFTTKEITTLGTRVIGQVPDVQTAILFMNGLTNAVSATGGGIMELENAQRALTQTFIKTKPSLEELNKQFNNANIPVMRVLAEELAKGTVTLKGYTDASYVSAQTTNVTTKAYAKAAEQNKYLGDQIKITKEKLDAATNAKKVNQSSVDSLKLSLRKEQDQWNENTTAIDSYTKAISSDKIAVPFHKSVEQIMADLQEVSGLGVTGADTAKAIAEAMTIHWKDANKTVLSTFTGTTRNIVDQLQYIQARILGIDENLEVKKGSIFYYLKEGVNLLSNTLTKHRDDIVNFFTGLTVNKDALIALAAVFTTLLLPALLWVMGPWLAMGKLLFILTPALFLVGKGVLDLKDHFGGLGNIIDNLKTPFRLLSDFFHGFDPTIKPEEIASWSWLARILSQVRDIISDLPSIFEEAKKQIATIMVELVTGITSPIPLSWEESSKKLHDAVVVPIQNEIQQLKNAFVFGNMQSPIPASWHEVINKLIENLKNLGNAVLMFVTPYWNAFWQSLRESAPSFKIIMDNIQGLIPILLLLALPFIKLGALWSGLVMGFIQATPGIMKLFSGLLEFFNGVWEIIQSLFSGNFELLKKGFYDLWNGIQITMNGFFEAITGFVKGFIEGVIGWFQFLYDTLIGKSIIPEMFAAILNALNIFKPLFISGVEDFASQVINSFSNMSNSIQGTINKFKEWSGLGGKSGKGASGSFQHGGIIPGPIGAPVPIMAHGGEMVTPTTGVVGGGNQGGGGGITINMTGSISMDSEERVRQLAYQIVRILGRQNELARYGTGY